MGTGFVLPTAAAATLVVAGSGYLGARPIGFVDDHAASVHQEIQSLATDRSEIQEAKSGSTTTAALAVAGRAARDSERQRVALVTAEDARRAADEASRAAAGVTQITSTATTRESPAPGAAAGVGGATAPGTPRAASTTTKTSASAPPASGSRSWVRPFPSGYTKTSGYGPRWGSMHPAQDFAMPTGSPVYAMSSGTVVLASWQGGYGYKVEIRYWDGTTSWYCHNSTLKVTAGQTVAPGQLVALSGNTGNSTGPHVHMEIHTAGGSTVPPLGWLASKGLNM